MSNSIVRNYAKYSIDFNLHNSRLNFSLVLESKNFSKPNGVFIFGPIKPNLIYSIILRICSNDFTDCFSSWPKFFSETTAMPENLTRLEITASNSTNIRLKWDIPEQPNSFSIQYLVFRRLTCFETIFESSNCSDNKTHVCCSGVKVERKHGFECCDGNYVPKPIEYETVCCGGRFYRSMVDHRCCAGLYYVYVPIGHVCCSNLQEAMNKEIRLSIFISNILTLT
jgi:hypothetical protein